MLLDSSVCNVNPLCTLLERVCLPTSTDPKHASQGAALDFKAVHKRVKVRLSDQGLLLFQARGPPMRLWGLPLPVFSLLVAASRGPAAAPPAPPTCLRAHKAWLCVDDLLMSLLHSRAPEQLSLVVAYLSLIGALISWKKASFGPRVTWCGWQFCFRTETVKLAQPKLDKLREQLLHLLQNKLVPRNSSPA